MMSGLACLMALYPTTKMKHRQQMGNSACAIALRFTLQPGNPRNSLRLSLGFQLNLHGTVSLHRFFWSHWGMPGDHAHRLQQYTKLAKANSILATTNFRPRFAQLVQDGAV